MSNSYFDKNVFNKGKAFIPFITAGYPELNFNKKIVLARVKGGGGLNEIGITVLEPHGGGTVIQHLSMEAIKRGKNTEKGV